MAQDTERDLKRCTMCDSAKPVAEFYKKLDGLTARCKTCLSSVGRAQRAADPQKYREQERQKLAAPEAYQRKLAQNRQWYASHQQHNLDRKRRYYADNREALAGYTKRWRARNPERARELWNAYAAQRRARLAGVETDPEPIMVSEIGNRDEWLCYLCTEPVDPALKWPHPRSASLDHVIPIVLHGPHTRGNVKLAHLACNFRKGAKDPWLGLQGSTAAVRRSGPRRSGSRTC